MTDKVFCPKGPEIPSVPQGIRYGSMPIFLKVKVKNFKKIVRWCLVQTVGYQNMGPLGGIKVQIGGL